MHDHPPDGARQRPDGPSTEPTVAQPVARWGRIPAWWLDHPDLDADGFAVLAALATYADESGVCWPSQATLAAKLKRSRPTVNRILGRLETAGLVAIEHRSSANGGRLSCRYRLRLTQDGSEAPAPVQSRPAAKRAAGTADSTVHIPCPAPSQEQLQFQQIPDSLKARAQERTENQRGVAEVPDGWQPAATDRAWAAERFVVDAGELDRHAELFVTRCRAHGYRYRDIGAAWRAWLLQDLRPAKRQSADRPQAKPAVQRNQAAEQRLNAWAAAAARLQSVPPTAPAWARP